jgi:hypothetical protein
LKRCRFNLSSTMTEPGGFQSPDGEILMLCFTEKDILA